MSHGFSFQRERVFHVNICVLVCNCYFELIYIYIYIYIFFFFWDLTSGTRAKVRVETMAREEGKGLGIKKFDGTDFVYWRMQIEDYLYGKKLHLPLLGKKTENMKDED